MADSFTELNPGAGGSDMDEEAVTYGTAPLTRKRTRVQISGASQAEIARVLNTDPALTDYGVVVRRVGKELFQSANNSSTATLLAAATFTGVADDVSRYEAITVNLFAAPAKAQATLFLEFSPDGTNWDVSIPWAVQDVSLVIPIPLRPVLPFFRVRLTNGATNLTTVRLTTMYHLTRPDALTRTALSIIGPSEPVNVVRAMIEPGFGYASHFATGADRTTQGEVIVGERINQLEASFVDALANNDVTTTVTGTGTVTQAAGLATIASGVGVLGASAKLVTTELINAKPGAEAWVQLDVAFTTPGAATENQRAGAYDASNGFFLGYQGTTFGLTLRTATVDTFIPLTAVNGDKLDGSSLSRFTRNGVVEVMDPTKLNTWRGFSSGITGIVLFEILSPDGVWIVVETVAWPNAHTTTLVQNDDLPVAVEVSKVATDATNLQILTSSWSAGIIASAVGFTPSELHSRIHVDANVAGATAATTTVYTVPAGHTFFMTSYSISVFNASVAAADTASIRDNATVKIPHSVPAGTAGAPPPWVTANAQFSEPIPFTTSVVLALTGGTPTCSLTVVGYIQRT